MKLLCIKSHSLGYVIKGQHYEILDVYPNCCKCYSYLYDVGEHPHPRSSGYLRCNRCGTREKDPNPKRLLVASTLFADPDVDIQSLKEEFNEEDLKNETLNQKLKIMQAIENGSDI